MVIGRGRALSSEAPRSRPPRRRPSDKDLRVRARTKVALGVLGFGSVVVLCVLGAVSELVDFRLPWELMAAPGVVALASIVICRDRRRRDADMDFAIFSAAFLSVLVCAITVAAWPGPIEGAFWAAALLCGLTCWTLQYTWRAR